MVMNGTAKRIPECYTGLFESLGGAAQLIGPQQTSPRNTSSENKTTSQLMAGVEGRDKDLNSDGFAFVIGPLFGLFIIFWNVLLIWSLIKKSPATKNIREMSITKKLFIYHSCTDLLAGALVVPIQIAMHFGHGYTCWYMSFALMLTSFSQCSGVSTLVFISVVRYYSIRYALKPVSPKKILLGLFIQFSINCGIAVHTFIVYFSRSLPVDIAFNFFLIFVYLVTYCCILVFVNVKSSLLIKSMATRRRFPYDVQDKVKHTDVVFTLHLITICFVMCIMPYAFYAMFLGTYLKRNDASLMEYFGYLEKFMPFHLLYLLNSGLPAAIYLFKMGLLKSLFCFCCNKWSNVVSSSLSEDVTSSSNKEQHQLQQLQQKSSDRSSMVDMTV